MKSIFVPAISILLSFTSLDASAWGYEKLKYEDRTVRVSGINPQTEHVFKRSEFDGGVYIVATESLESKEIASKSTEVIRQRFIANGIKVVDSPEKAAIGIRFLVFNMNTDKYNAFAEQNHGGFAANVGRTAAATAAAGVSGLTSFGKVGGRKSTSIDLYLEANAVALPKTDALSDGFISQVSNKDTLKVVYYIPDGSTVQDVLDVTADQWIKNFIK
jgi:hypothetical protein